MPICDSVNPQNTPTAYSGMSLLVSPEKTTISTAATAASARMPLENTSRSPRFFSCAGRYPSWDRIDDTRGKSANAVFAARIKIANVENCRT